MKVISRIILLLAVFIAGIVIGIGLVKKPAIAPTLENKYYQPIEENQEIKVKLVLDFGNEEVKIFNQVNLVKNASVFNLLSKVTQENNIEFSYREYGSDLGAFIESIDNIKNNPTEDQFWQYWVNGEYANIGASNYQLTDGDIVEWKYLKNQF